MHNHKPLVIGLYSPEPQSGKSTACKALATIAPLKVVKVSGSMKAMCKAAIAPFVPATDIDTWIDGAHKDTPIPGLTAQACITPDVVQALLESITDTPNTTCTTLPFQDAQGQPITRTRLMHDMETTWKTTLERIQTSKGNLTPRDLQKTIGLEWGRTLYGNQFWLQGVEAQLNRVQTPIAVVDDVRFPDDADLIERRGGLLVRIWKPQTHKPDTHPSEGLLEYRTFHARLDNTGDLTAYAHQIHTLLLPLVRTHLTP